MHKTPLTQNRLSLTQLQAIRDGTPSQTGALSTTPTNHLLRNESNSKTPASAYNFQIHYTRARFEKFINSAFQHPQKLCLYFEQIKSNLSVKLEEISSPNNLLSHFDRIVERLLNQKTKSSHNKWTDGEVHLLTHIVVFYSYLNNTDFENLTEEGWSFLSSIFPNKEAGLLRKRWQGCLKKTLRQVPWTQSEDELLKSIIQQKEYTHKWKEVADELNARSELNVYRYPRQCRERWNNYLDPNVTKGRFTEEEDVELFRAYKQLGKKWAEIAKRMKTRTENAVKNRFNSLIKKLKAEQNTGLLENLSMIPADWDINNNIPDEMIVDQFLRKYESQAQEEKSKTHLGESNLDNSNQSPHLDPYLPRSNDCRDSNSNTRNSSISEDQHQRTRRSDEELDDNLICLTHSRMEKEKPESHNNLIIGVHSDKKGLSSQSHLLGSTSEPYPINRTLNSLKLDHCDSTGQNNSYSTNLSNQWTESHFQNDFQFDEESSPFVNLDEGFKSILSSSMWSSDHCTREDYNESHGCGVSKNSLDKARDKKLRTCHCGNEIPRERHGHQNDHQLDEISNDPGPSKRIFDVDNHLRSGGMSNSCAQRERINLQYSIETFTKPNVNESPASKQAIRWFQDIKKKFECPNFTI